MRRSIPLLKFVDYHRVLGVPRDAGKVWAYCFRLNALCDLFVLPSRWHACS